MIKSMLCIYYERIDMYCVYFTEVKRLRHDQKHPQANEQLASQNDVIEKPLTNINQKQLENSVSKSTRSRRTTCAQHWRQLHMRKRCFRRQNGTIAENNSTLIGEFFTMGLVKQTRKKHSRSLTQSQKLQKMHQQGSWKTHDVENHVSKRKSRQNVKYPKNGP